MFFFQEHLQALLSDARQLNHTLVELISQSMRAVENRGCSSMSRDNPCSMSCDHFLNKPLNEMMCHLHAQLLPRWTRFIEMAQQKVHNFLKKK